MSPTRRALLSAAVGSLSLGFAGCLDGRLSEGSSGGGGSATAGPTRRDTSTPSPTATSRESPDLTEVVPSLDADSCPAEPQVPDAEIDPEKLASVPEPPDSFENEELQSYVEDYEYAYQWRAWSGYGHGVYEFYLDVSFAETAIDGETAFLQADYALPHGRWDTDGTGTPYGYFDGAEYSFAYLVTDAAVWRAEAGHREEPPELGADWTLLQCFE